MNSYAKEIPAKIANLRWQKCKLPKTFPSSTRLRPDSITSRLAPQFTHCKFMILELKRVEKLDLTNNNVKW